MHSQIYLLLSCCPCEGRVSGIVDVPNACCTLAIPTAIFDQASSDLQLACDLAVPSTPSLTAMVRLAGKLASQQAAVSSSAPYTTVFPVTP